MVWKVFLGLSLCTLLGAIALAVVFACSIKEKRGRTVFWTLAVGVAITATLVFVPYYYCYFDGVSNKALKTVFMSFHNTIRLFVVDGDYGFIMDNVATLPSELKSFYTAYTAATFVAPPLFTFGFILMFLKF